MRFTVSDNIEIEQREGSEIILYITFGLAGDISRKVYSFKLDDLEVEQLFYAITSIQSSRSNKSGWRTAITGISEEFRKLYSHLYQNHEAVVNISLPEKHLDLMSVEELTDAVGEFMEEMGFEYETENEPILGSFFQTLKFKLKSPKTEDEVTDIYEKGKAALQAKYLNAPTAENTAKLAEAAGKLIDRLGPFNKVAVRAGSILIVKTIVGGEPILIVETISPLLANVLDQNPAMINDPDKLMMMLSTPAAPLTGMLEEGDVPA